MTDGDEARVVITNADIAAAKRDWQLARSRGDLPDRIDAAYDLYRRLVSAQAQQIVRFGVRILEASTPREGQPGQKPSPAPKPDVESDERLRKILPRLHALFPYTD